VEEEAHSPVLTGTTRLPSHFDSKCHFIDFVGLGKDRPRVDVENAEALLRRLQVLAPKL